MTSYQTPRRIEWAGPEGWTVWADEDGVHVRAAGGHVLEQPDVQRLFDLWSEAKSFTASGTIPAPKPPTREERMRDSDRWSEAHIARRAIRVIKDEFGPTATDQPF